MMKLKEIQERYDKLDAIRAKYFWAKLIFQYTLIARSVYPEADEGFDQAIKILKSVNENVLSVSKQLINNINGRTQTDQSLRLLTELMETAKKFNYEESFSFALSKAFNDSENT